MKARFRQLNARLASPLALYRKLERESYRAFHAVTPLHKADHFFNFCVTASSMRDYTLEHLGKATQVGKAPYYIAWAPVPVLVAAVEVANSAKHFVLRNRAIKTKAVRIRKALFLDIYVNDAGETKVIPSQRSEVHITLSDGQVLELHAFTHQVLEYWKNYLMSLGMRVRRQPFGYLTGHKT